MADDKTKDKGKEPGSDQSTKDAGTGNPREIDAPGRTGIGPNTESTTAGRDAEINMKPIESLPPSDRAEAEVLRAVDEAMHKEYVQQEAERRVRAERAKRLMDSVNTNNPYGLKENQKPVYQVGAHLVDPDGVRIKKVSDVRSGRVERVIDPATSMKEM